MFRSWHVSDAVALPRSPPRLAASCRGAWRVELRAEPASPPRLSTLAGGRQWLRETGERGVGEREHARTISRPSEGPSSARLEFGIGGIPPIPFGGVNCFR
jgi:hypothetical protein